MNNSTLRVLIEIVEKSLDLDEQVHQALPRQNLSDMDSLTLVQLILGIERELGCRLSISMLRSVQTLDELACLIERVQQHD